MKDLLGHLRIVSIVAIFSHIIFYEKLAQAGTLTDLYVFGDSSVDDGNLFELTGEPGEPYFEGRFSNGQLYVELIPEQLGFAYNSDHNYAVAGARTDSHALNEDGTIIDQGLGFDGQVERFINETATVDEQALYVISVGGNDYLENGFDLNSDGQINQADTQSVITNITTSIQRLTNAGARNFLVVGLFDYAKAPLISTSLDYTDEEKQRISSLVGIHNENLQNSLTNLSNVNISFFDVNRAFEDNINRFTNTEDPCLASDLVCDTPEEYVFWDELHPTATANEVLADEIVRILQAGEEEDDDGLINSAVPEPLTILGVGTAAIFGLFFKRKLSNLPKDGDEATH